MQLQDSYMKRNYFLYPIIFIIPTKEPQPYDICRITNAFIKYKKHNFFFKANDKLIIDIKKIYNNKDINEIIPIGK